MKIIIPIITFFIAALISFAFYARVFEQRSAVSKWIEMGFKIGNLTNRDYTDETAAQYLKEKEEDHKQLLYDGTPYDIPYNRFNNDVKEINEGQLRIIHLEAIQAEGPIIIYLAGGAYVNQPSFIHYRFIDELATKTNAHVYMPLYPLAPSYGVEDALDLLLPFYARIQNEYPNQKIILMGDSAGAGLALAFTMHLNTLNQTIPSQLILNAPWLDIHLNDPMVETIQKRDPFLRQNNAVYLGDAWRKDVPADDYRVSPLYGDYSNLPKTLMIIGTYDILYPDTLTFKEKANASGVDLTYIAKDKMLHVYPLFPFLPEANDTLEQIIDFILTES